MKARIAFRNLRNDANFYSKEIFLYFFLYADFAYIS